MTGTRWFSNLHTSNLVALVAGLILGYFLFSTAQDETPMDAQSGHPNEIDYWVAPMDPNYRRDGPGKSPMGMDLVPVFKGESPESPDGNDIGFTVSPNVLSSLGVKTAPARFMDFASKIAATGRIMYDETRVTHVQMRTEGWVEELAVRAIGDKVEKGELLFRFYSPELENALAEYGQAIVSGSKRLQSLSRARLHALGLDKRTIEEARQSGDWSKPVSIHAPASGVVTKMGIREGSFSAKNTIAFEITDLANVWLIANVFESQSENVMIGQSVEISGFDYNAVGTIDYIYPELDPQLQTVRVRINLPNEGGRLKAGQFYQAILLSKPARLLTVPDNAVIRLGSGNRVIIAHGDGRFEAAEVQLGNSSDGDTVIRSGLREGERVVTSGQFMLDSESSFSGAALRMSGDVKDIEP